MAKPYNEQTPEERLKSLDRIQNVLGHADWQEMYLLFNDAAVQAQYQMDNAPSWDSFVAARAVKLYVQGHLLNLRERVKAEREELEADLTVAADDPLPEDL